MNRRSEGVHHEAFLRYQIDMLSALPAPLEAIGIGGSVGAGTADESADLDFFLLAADDGFLQYATRFPELVTHPTPPLARWHRGFSAGFGYQCTFVYRGALSVDYNLNCPAILQPTPMALKTTIVIDRTGYYTAFLSSIREASHASDEAVRSAAAEFLVELLKIRKFVMRGELVPLIHRLERLRLVLLGLERVLQLQQPYSPHDADKWVRRDLGPAVDLLLGKTFAHMERESALLAFEELYSATMRRLSELGPHPALSHDFIDVAESAAMAVRERLGAGPAA